MARKKSLVPKGCTIHRISLDGRGNAEIGFRCGDEGHGKMFPSPDGGMGTYRAIRVKARSISHRGITISGEARIGFTLSPAAAVCRKDGLAIVCRMVGDTSSPSLQGLSGAQQGRIERMKPGKLLRSTDGQKWRFGSVIWGGTSPTVCLTREDGTHKCNTAADWKRLGVKI